MTNIIFRVQKADNAGFGPSDIDYFSVHYESLSTFNDVILTNKSGPLSGVKSTGGYAEGGFSGLIFPSGSGVVKLIASTLMFSINHPASGWQKNIVLTLRNGKIVDLFKSDSPDKVEIVGDTVYAYILNVPVAKITSSNTAPVYTPTIPVAYNCSYCGQSFKTARLLADHEAICELNPADMSRDIPSTTDTTDTIDTTDTTDTTDATVSGGLIRWIKDNWMIVLLIGALALLVIPGRSSKDD